jgi:MFS family permease
MKKNQHTPTTRQKNVTITFGYSLFILTVIGVIVSTIIPWTNIFYSPHVNQLNALVFMISLTVGVILPTLISYFLGDRATHVKNKASHHYNGVLFGIAAYWLSLVFGVIGGYTISAVRDTFQTVVLSAIVNGWPILATTVVMMFVAISYARHQKKKASVMEHAPYQWVLVGSIIAVFALGIVNQIMTGFSYLVSVLIPICMTVIAILISYAALRNQPSRRVRLMSALVATTIGLVALSVANQLAVSVFFVGPAIAPIFFASGFGLFVWIAYLGIAGRKG